MAKITIEDPDLHVKKSVDSNGRVYLGKDYKNKNVRVTVELAETSEDAETGGER